MSQIEGLILGVTILISSLILINLIVCKFILFNPTKWRKKMDAKFAKADERLAYDLLNVFNEFAIEQKGESDERIEIREICETWRETCNRSINSA